jgi:predicted nucleic acid-binding protein
VKTFVLDASVGAKWFLPAAGEPLTSEAQDLLARFTRGQVRFLVPDLFWPELGSVLWKATAHRRITQPHAEKSIALARQLRLVILPGADLIERALALTLASGRSVYDSMYIAAAIEKSVDLVTADEKLVNATGSRFPVRWLGALGGVP